VARFEYRLVDVFAPLGPPQEGLWRPSGNPLAVFTDARGIDPALMQRIAFELNLSERTFVLPTSRPDCDVRVRIFTPRAEIPMAGHPTVGTVFVLDRGDRIVFEEGVGPVPGLAAADLVPDLPCEWVATGPSFLIVPLRSVEALSRARLRSDLWEPIERSVGGAQPYLFAATGAATARCRMFAPSHGIAEDPATGGAAGPLGAYWSAHGIATPSDDDVLRLTFTQGVEFGRPSELFVEVEGATIRVAGACHAVGGGWFEFQA
jgi:trans-2,3-dihydro-3-hydroxyanthranilate isomerase